MDLFRENSKDPEQLGCMLNMYVWYGMVRYGMIRRFGMVWDGMVWYGMVWYKCIITYITIPIRSPYL